jgi:L-rhamnose mutarotase
MKRKAYLMSLKPGVEAEYERRHNPIWPELQQMLKDHGVSNYSIFLDRNTRKLFAYVEIESEELWSKIAEAPVCKRWWAEMKELIFSNPDNSPIVEVIDEVFHMD